ncbi:MAG: hypothetical protein RR710_04190 [Oscillospiraceae bacterium]
MTTKTTTATHDIIEALSRKATAGTLKRIYDASGNDNIRKLRTALQHDYSILDNNLSDTISDAYDCHLTAYNYLLEQYNNGLTADNTITTTLKNGTEKTRTIYQWACVAVRKYIYSNKSIENNGKYIYIEDMATEKMDSNLALDCEYIRLNKYSDLASDTQYGISGAYNDYITYNDIIASLNLTHRQLTVVTMRMQGLSTVAIADKLQVSQQAISKTLAQVQTYVSTQYPDMVRLFKTARKA